MIKTVYDFDTFMDGFDKEFEQLTSGLTITKDKFDGRLGDPKAVLKSYLHRYVSFHVNSLLESARLAQPQTDKESK